MQGKQKAEQAKKSSADRKVNMAMTEHDSVFPNIHLKGGISAKATEYKKIAMSGDTWHSPVFKLGKASTSSNIPDATTVTRKHHSVTNGGVHEPHNISNTGPTTAVTRNDHFVTDGGVRGPQNISNTGSTTNQVHEPAAQAAGAASGPATNGPPNIAFSNEIDRAFSVESTTAAVTNGKTTNVKKTNDKTNNDRTTLD
jgi:hypothetical protein